MLQERTDKLLHVLYQRQPDLTVILENINDPHNISAIMRTCDAVGIADLYVLNTTIARHERFGPRSSSSADKWVNIYQFDNLEACISEVRKKYDFIYTTHLATDAVSLYEMDLTRSIALVFGNEHSGCSDAIIAKADGNFIIPQAGIIQSLNVSVACAVTIYEAYRQKKAVGHYDTCRLPETKQQELMLAWKMYDFVKKENGSEGV